MFHLHCWERCSVDAAATPFSHFCLFWRAANSNFPRLGETTLKEGDSAEVKVGSAASEGAISLTFKATQRASS